MKRIKMIENAVEFEQRLRIADCRDKLDDIFLINCLNYGFGLFPGTPSLEVVDGLVEPELKYYQSQSKEYRCYQTRRCLLCNKKLCKYKTDHTEGWVSPFEFHNHALTEGHIQKYLELGNAWARYRKDLAAKESFDEYAVTKGVRIAHKTEVLNDFIEILSAITRHKAWITKVAG